MESWEEVEGVKVAGGANVAVDLSGKDMSEADFPTSSICVLGTRLIGGRAMGVSEAGVNSDTLAVMLSETSLIELRIQRRNIFVLGGNEENLTFKLTQLFYCRYQLE